MERDACVQIHFTDAAHWNTSGRTVERQVVFVDSVYSEPNEYVRMQMVSIYRDGSDQLPFTVQPSQKQSGGLDCGAFAISNAFELAAGTTPDALSKIRFDQSAMRQHLLACFEAQAISAFPQLPASQRPLRLAKPVHFLLDVDSLGLTKIQ